MKKLLGIVVLSFLWSSISFAELITLTKCFYTDFNEKSSYGIESFSYKNFNEQKADPSVPYENKLVTLDTAVETITITIIYKDTFIKKMREIGSMLPKYKKYIYRVTDLGGNVATGDLVDHEGVNVITDRIDVDFVSNKLYGLRHIRVGDGEIKNTSTQQCKRQK